MPVFAFKGVDAQGKKVSGNREAENSKTLKTTLRREGVFLTDLKETGSKKGGGLELVRSPDSVPGSRP